MPRLIPNLVVSQSIQLKLLDKHQVTVREVEQCFENKLGGFLEDDREDHKSDPPTLWFIASTNRGRKLKVVFIPRDGKLFLRTAYEPEPAAIAVYEELGH